MKRRTPIFAAIAGLGLTLLSFSPAQGAHDDPVVAGLDGTTAGVVTGTVTSAAPFVSVRLGTEDVPQILELQEGSATFELETWGYSGTLPVLVASCDVGVPLLPTDCSTELPSAESFTVTDVLPDVTWPVDLTVGPADEPTVTASDPFGGGDLRAVWITEGDQQETPVPRDIATPLNLSDGAGLVRLVRCRTGSTTVCTAFSPDQKVDLTVDTVLSATVAVDPGTLTAGDPVAVVTVDTDVTGAYDLTWALEKDGSPVAGPGGSGEASGTLDPDGAATFELDGSTLLDGTYDLLVTITVTDPDFGAFPATEVQGAVTVNGSGPVVVASVGPVATITQANPTSTVTVDTDATGTYSLTWSLEQGETEIPGATVAGTLDVNGAATFELDGTGLADGDYDIVTTITVTDPDIGELPSAGATGTVTIAQAGPAVTLTRSVGTIYPLIATSSYPTLTRIDIAGDQTPVTGYVVQTASGKPVRDLPLNWKIVWNGRNNDGKVVPAGTYAVFALDADGNRSASSATVVVSRQTLVLRKFVREVTASGTLYDKYVGRCSILKTRSSRYTPGSLGYFSNSKCGTQTFSASAVSTAHALQIPDLGKPVDMHIKVVGGASKGYAGSRGVLRYLTVSGNWAFETPVSTRYGIHQGPTTKLTKFLDKDNFLVWGFVTAYGSYYDVTRFTVVVRYYGLS